MTDMRALLNLITESKVLDEMPIQHFQTVGDFEKSHSFRHPEDRKLLTHPKAVMKIHKKFANNQFDFNMFFVNMKGASKFLEQGEVSPAWMEQNLPQAWKEIAPNLSDESINVVFTNNSGGERYPMTAWIIGHRMGHALYSVRGSGRYNSTTEWREAEKILSDATDDILEMFGMNASGRGPRYGSPLVGEGNKVRMALYHALGTMKSARDRNLRNAHEFLHELLAQYLTTGRIDLHRAESIITHFAWGRPQMRYAHPEHRQDLHHRIMMLENDLTTYIEEALHAATGKIFVM